MKIYITIIEDRHIDVQAIPFSTPEKAIARAKEWTASVHFPEEIEESEIDGWLYYASYLEGDNVHVIEMELDGA